MKTDVIRVRQRANRTWAVSVTSDGRDEELTGAAIVSSMPITELIKKLDPPPPAEVLAAAGQLKYRDFLTVCLIVKKPSLFPDNWIYVHDPAVFVARVQNFKNWSADMVADPATSTLGLEYFCTKGDALWNLTDDELVDLGRRELEQIGLGLSADVESGCVFRVPQAYPIYDADYRVHLDTVRKFVDNLEGFQTAGRNGLHRYNNQDHAMLTGMLAVRNLLNGERHDLWSINGEQAYLEQARSN